MMILTRNAILNADDRQIERVDVPEWGGHVCVRSMTGADRDEFDALAVNRQVRGVRTLVVTRTACDEHGELLFTDADVEKLLERNAAALHRVFEAGCTISGIGEDEIEDAEGN
jgi:hypothetical protein